MKEGRKVRRYERRKEGMKEGRKEGRKTISPTERVHNDSNLRRRAAAHLFHVQRGDADF
jgi:hypothetical protein